MSRTFKDIFTKETIVVSKAKASHGFEWRVNEKKK